MKSQVLKDSATYTSVFQQDRHYVSNATRVSTCKLLDMGDTWFSSLNKNNFARTSKSWGTRSVICALHIRSGPSNNGTVGDANKDDLA